MLDVESDVYRYDIYIYIGLLMTMNSSMSSISSMANTQDADDE